MELEPIVKLTKDLKKAAATLSDAEARFLVDSYYQMQSDRIRAGNQVRSMQGTNEPHVALSWLMDNSSLLERNIKAALDTYSNAHPVGLWSKSIVGIGPVLAAGLLAHIDLEPWVCGVAKADPTQKRCRLYEPHSTDLCGRKRIMTVGHIWSFGGLDPTVTWEKHTRRPWNAKLKVLTWKCGESFVKVSGHEEDFYGKLYLQRKEYEIGRNDRGELADQAKKKLDTVNISKSTDAYRHYAAGHLPPAHIHARAKRWAVKLFLAHWFEAAYFSRYGVLPPKPYVLTHVAGHVHEIEPPNQYLIAGWEESRRKVVPTR